MKLVKVGDHTFNMDNIVRTIDGKDRPPAFPKKGTEMHVRWLALYFVGGVATTGSPSIQPGCVVLEGEEAEIMRAYLASESTVLVGSPG